MSLNSELQIQVIILSRFFTKSDPFHIHVSMLMLAQNTTVENTASDPLALLFYLHIKKTLKGDMFVVSGHKITTRVHDL